MIPNDKSRLLIAALVAAIVFILGYGLFRALSQEEVPITPAPTAAHGIAQSSSEPGQPALTIEGEISVIANTPGHQTTATGDGDLRFQWFIQGGTIEGDYDRSTVVWSAGNGPSVVVTCKATNGKGLESVATLRVSVRKPPVIARFEATPPIITEGAKTNLTWTVSNYSNLMLMPGDRDFTDFKGPTLEVSPRETTAYTLSASDSAGFAVTKELTVKVVPAPKILSLTADPIRGSASTFQVTGAFSGGKAELKSNGSVLGASEASPLSLQITDVKEGSVFLLKVTNEAGDYQTTELTFSASTK